MGDHAGTHVHRCISMRDPAPRASYMEGLCNLDKLVGKGRFRFIGFPLKIKGGTGSPIRAVALLDN